MRKLTFSVSSTTCSKPDDLLDWDSSRPGEASTSYALQTTFPSKDLEDDSITLKEAGLLGSVVVQRSL